MKRREETKTARYRRRFNALKSERSAQGWDAHWRELAEYFSPVRGRYLKGDSITQHNDGRKKHDKIINGSAVDARRTLAGGMQGGLTSPSRPWFRLTTHDKSLAEKEGVRDYLSVVRDQMLMVFARSNFYASAHTIYDECGVFGTGCMLIESDARTVIRCRPFTIGEYCLALDSSYRPSALYRQFSMTVEQLVGEFEWGNLDKSIQNAWDAGNYDHRFEVVHVIEVNNERDERYADFRGKAYKSAYFLLSGDSDKLLRESGYNEIPFVAPRWEVVGVDTYGVSPGMAALGDAKQLQLMELKKLKALDKQVDPPMVAPAGLRAVGGTLAAGGVNYIDETAANIGLRPAMENRTNFADLRLEIDAVEQRIRRFFFNDLFLSVLNQEKRMTATEIAKRHEEKLVMLGPILERLDSEFLDPVIDRTFSIMNDLGILPPAPPELQGQELKIEYISLLAQAQKIVGTSAVDQLMTFVGAVAGMKPDVLDKVDLDQAVDVYSDMLGVPPSIVNSDDKVEELRASRAQQQQLMQMAQMAQPISQIAQAASSAADAAKTSSETSQQTPGGPALAALMSGV
jgi:hypothetical protein